MLSLAGSAVLVGAIVQRLTTDRFAAVVSGLLLARVIGPYLIAGTLLILTAGKLGSATNT